ncbi:MAG: DUF1905 domain-containing protein [Candidatus Nanopelagicales bacterium]
MSEAFITKVITPGIKGAESALEALRGLIFEDQSVALLSDESDERFLHPHQFQATGPIFEWRGPAPFYFVKVDEQQSAEIRKVANEITYGWGVLPVEAEIGLSRFTTSLFPKDNLYLFPLKKEIRLREQLELDDEVSIRFTLGLDSFDASDLYSDDPTLILLTGGTTASRKGVELSLGALKASAKASESVTGKNLLWVTALTPTSIAGANTMIRSLLNGFEPVIFQGIGGAEPFLPNTFIPTLQEALSESQKQSAPLATSLVPTQIYRLLESPEALQLLSEFEVVLVGGAKLNTSSRGVLEDAGVRVIETYGATETSGGCIYDGVPLPGVNAIIEKGSLHIFGKTNAAYYRSGTPLAKWDSGDVAEIIDGKIVIQGRTDNQVKVGGIKVNIDEFQTSIQAEFPDIAIAVIAIEDEEYGHRVVVYSTKTLENLRDIARKIIGNVPVPIGQVIVDSIPLMVNGKIDFQTLKNLNHE